MIKLVQLSHFSFFPSCATSFYCAKPMIATENILNMVIIRLTLPFPPPELNPNKRLHWTQKTKIKNTEKDIGYALALAHRGQITGNAHLSLVFHASTNRSYDLDNALASAKAVLDGIALGLGINDRQFRPITIDRGIVDKDNPRLEITITAKGEG